MLIAYTLSTEVLGWYILKNEEYQIIYEGLAGSHTNNNTAIYNIFDVILFMYFYYIYWRIIRKSIFKKIIKYGSLVFILVSIVNPFFQNFWKFPQIFALTVGSLVLILSVCFYFKDLKDKKIGTPLRSNLLFWISLGLIIFYPFYPAFVIIGLYQAELYMEWFKISHQVLIAAMYLSFIIGFSLMRRFKQIKTI